MSEDPIDWPRLWRWIVGALAFRDRIHRQSRGQSQNNIDNARARSFEGLLLRQSGRPVLRRCTWARRRLVSAWARLRRIFGPWWQAGRSVCTKRQNPPYSQPAELTPADAPAPSPRPRAGHSCPYCAPDTLRPRESEPPTCCDNRDASTHRIKPADPSELHEKRRTTRVTPHAVPPLPGPACAMRLEMRSATTTCSNGLFLPACGARERARAGDELTVHPPHIAKAVP